MFRHTTVLAVRNNNNLVIGGDGQVSMGNSIFKSKANKIRFLYEKKILAGFSGATADAITLFEKFEGYLQKYSGNLLRSSVELAKEWRTDKFLRHLEALLVVGNTEKILLLSGSGDVIEPDDDIIAIGSGGQFALAAARALMQNSKLSIKEIVEKSLKIAAEICVYTNSNLQIEVING